MVLPQIVRHGAICLVIVDPSFPSRDRIGRRGATVCGQLGKPDNFQMRYRCRWPIAMRACRSPTGCICRRSGRATVRVGARRGSRGDRFKTKPEIALDQLRWACAVGLPRGVVLLDAGYGNNSELRADITALGLTYAAGILSTTTVWPPGARPLPATTWSGRGRPPKLMRRDDRHRPVSVKALALGLPKRAWRTIEWREGAAEPLRSRFARLRVRAAHRDYWLAECRPEEWLLIEWPKGESEPTKYWLSTLPKNIAFPDLVDTAKLRWRIERDYQELKQEVGLGHFEGRGWRGFHHHATLCIAAYGFLISEREGFPPQQIVPPGRSRNLHYPAVTDPADPPLRPERHVPNSIATMRRRLIAALVKTLPRCPCCAAPIKKQSRSKHL